MGVVVQTLSAAQISQAQQQAQAIANSANPPAAQPNQFVFFAAFDGTFNDRNNVALLIKGVRLDLFPQSA